MKLVIGPEAQIGHNPEQRYMQAVEQAMEGPFIRYSKRLELMKLAKELRINRFQANLMIAQAQQRTGRIMDTLSDAYESVEVSPVETKESTSGGWRERIILFGTIFIVAALADLALYKILFSH